MKLKWIILSIFIMLITLVYKIVCSNDHSINKLLIISYFSMKSVIMNQGIGGIDIGRVKLWEWVSNIWVIPMLESIWLNQCSVYTLLTICFVT